MFWPKRSVGSLLVLGRYEHEHRPIVHEITRVYSLQCSLLYSISLYRSIVPTSNIARVFSIYILPSVYSFWAGSKHINSEDHIFLGIGQPDSAKMTDFLAMIILTTEYLLSEDEAVQVYTLFCITQEDRILIRFQHGLLLRIDHN